MRSNLSILILLCAGLFACVTRSTEALPEPSTGNSLDASSNSSADATGGGGDGNSGNASDATAGNSGAGEGGAGGEGGMSTAGDDSGPSCDKPCPTPAKSWCDPDVGDCAACENTTQCSAFLGTTPVCKAGVGCVECTSDTNGHKLCTDNDKVCKAGGNVCVECNVTGDCDASSGTPVCDGESCRGCSEDSECTGGKTCDEDSGKCVQCTVDKEVEQCTNNKACDPVAKTCTGATRGTIDICLPCIADSECVENHRCVETFFGAGNVSQGGRCLKIGAAEGGCIEPYLATPINRVSLSGVPATDYCGISEAVTSCAAIKALEASALCAGGDAALCGASGALCKTVNLGANRCTYACSASATCPEDFPCKGPSGAKYCGGPN